MAKSAVLVALFVLAAARSQESELFQCPESEYFPVEICRAV